MTTPHTASPRLDTGAARAEIDALWRSSILPALIDYVRIPNQSPAFDREWAAHGHMARAVALAEEWARRHVPRGGSVEVVRLPERTPVLLVDVPGSAPGNVLLYGHLDKQPEMTGWSEGLGPWDPVVRGERLYGRGAADDGYALFAALAALRALAAQSIPHARCLILIECSEESGSTDLRAYVEHLEKRIGRPEMVVCLDSGCGDYDRLRCTTSLRGLIVGTLEVEVLREGVHSGDAGGIVPSSFRIARQLLERLEDASSGEIRLRELHAEPPEARLAQARVAAEILGRAVHDRFPWLEGAGRTAAAPIDLVLARTWRPSLEVTGAGGLPPIASAGNVLRPRTALRLSLRLPPMVEARQASKVVKQCLERDPPCGARVRFTGSGQSGWNAPLLAPWLEQALDRASRAWFGSPPAVMGEGGAIPFMGMLGERFPEAQFVITGVLGPGSNAHGPNEFLDLPTARRLSGCVAHLVAEHAALGGRRDPRG